ncbi:hypothetical protein M422DRAFT_239258 [Sphaerobolus stellatus SS14]|nr:hypothetical protein M422DRAFT_239258 [Sphaerobolus stellatus SS14]
MFSTSLYNCYKKKYEELNMMNSKRNSSSTNNISTTFSNNSLKKKATEPEAINSKPTLVEFKNKKQKLIN